MTEVQEEPPSPIVLIGRNSRGSWVAQERTGLFGGLFVSRIAAERYALFENGHHPENLVAAVGPLELRIGAAVDHDLSLPRRVA
jgi:hypothetical protein